MGVWGLSYRIDISNYRSGTTAFDSAAPANDGTYVGGPVLGQPSVDPARGTAVGFDGVDDRVEVPFDAALNPAGDFSFALWARVDGGSGGHRSPLTSRDDFPQRGYILYVTPQDTWEFWTGTNAGWASLSGGAVTTGEWTHVAGTFDAQSTTGGVHTGLKTIYINGVPVAADSQAYLENAAQILRIGAGTTESATAQFPFNGLIDEVHVYDHVLTEGEVAALAVIPEPGGLALAAAFASAATLRRRRRVSNV